MKTELNIEAKARFFAQYVGQKVFFTGELQERPHINNWGSKLINKKDFILLKPLSSITDEDSEVFRKIMHWPSKGTSVAQTIVLLNDNMFPMIVTDFLRSKGYALSWMGLSVEEMVQAGWIKLKERIYR